MEGGGVNLFEDRGADFSEDRRFRYLLWRIWNKGLPLLNCLMLNPSEADEEQGDPTVTRCRRRAQASGFGGLLVTNLFALVSPYPEALRGHENPVGTRNDAAILSAAQHSGMVLVAWGNDGQFRNRSAAVRSLLRQNGITMYALAVNSTGEPKHPLYCKTAIEPFVYFGN